ncbi:glutathione peroxidase [Bifidobacterium dolichotidis]|uniref:Glutathione peroxidase n=1 Tax=Bifidobacterium dolichotidis TaxID=2306976 RepID=A0A430FST3_9BIFI|nr:glutathione peroxidase [Bifidobacterium dolichotidis]RSX55933.1 glutathione peroxidase [Bifidobacterium dolichotidis]
MTDIYSIPVEQQDGTITTLEQYRGKVLLIVNTATGCGFTPQYKGLEELYKKYQDRGFVVLDFPCDQFGHQAPGTDEEINNFCAVKYNTTFPRFKKIDVNGDNTAPLYKYLKEEQNGLFGSAIKWNFTKFLVGREGHVVDRFAPATTPEQIDENIAKQLG